MFMKLKYPETVHSYEACDGSSPFDPITLTCAVCTALGYDINKHGVLSSVIRYFTPYKDSNGNRLLLCVALGNDMTVNTILGSPLIDQWQLELKFNPRAVISHKLHASFELKYINTARTHTPDSNNNAIAKQCNVNPSDATTTEVAAMVALAKGKGNNSSGNSVATYAWG